MNQTSRYGLARRLGSCALAAALFPGPSSAAPDPMGSLVTLVVERLSIGDQVALSKWYSGKPVEDVPREAALLGQVARKMHTDAAGAAYARTFFSDQIAASKMLQSALLQDWREQGPPHGEQPSLEEIRNRLDDLTDRIITVLPGVAAQSHASGCATHLQEVASQAALTLDAVHRAAFDTALDHVCTHND